MAVNDMYEATFYCVHGEQASAMTRWWQERNVLGTGATLASFATVLAAQVGAALKACIASTAQYRGFSLKKMTPLPPSVATINTTNQGAGGVVGDVLPRQVRGIITLNTAFAGRPWRGRVYVPFPAEPDNDADATPSAGYLTRLETLGTSLIGSYPAVGAGGNTSDFHAVMIRKTWDQFGNLTAVQFRADILSRIARERWATQRRSGTYGSPNISPV